MKFYIFRREETMRRIGRKSMIPIFINFIMKLINQEPTYHTVPFLPFK